MERYTKADGTVIEYPKPDAETAAFLARIVDAAHDPRVSWSELTDLVYSRENPIMDQTVFEGRGAVTAEVFENPLYHVMTDLLWKKQVVEQKIDPSKTAAAGTITVADAAEIIGVTPDAVRKAIRAERLKAWKTGGSYRVSRADAERYRDEVVPRAPRSSDPVLRARAGSEPGRSLRLKAPGKRKVGKTGSVVDLEVDTFERAAVATTGKKSMQVFVLEPSPHFERIEWGALGVEGRFRIVEHVTHPREAAAAWKAFEPR